MKISRYFYLLPIFGWNTICMFSIACAVRPTSSQSEYESFLHAYRQISTGMTEKEVKVVFNEPTLIQINELSQESWVYHISYQQSNPMTYAIWYQRTIAVCEVYLYVIFDNERLVSQLSFTASESCNH